jgi:1,4-alpha-glucan branching enzyme
MSWPSYEPLTDYDIYLFRQGCHYRLYTKMGAHPVIWQGHQGTCFRVWAPNASRVFVIGDFNNWKPNQHPLQRREDDSGIWEGFIEGIGQGTLYKYCIEPASGGPLLEKADPFAFFSEKPPCSASVVWDLEYPWQDHQWMEERRRHNALDAPWSIYEVHLGSWRRVPEEEHRFLTYRELAPLLTEHVLRTGFTHVEFLPVMEHPYYPSWGYQITGYYAPTARYGTPQDLMYLIDYLHRHGIGVILDWVPSHFATDGHGLGLFDGTHLYEHADPRQGYHPDWGSYIFNYGRHEVRAFLVSNACFWLEKYHADGLRIDAVASMLYLDYSRKPGDWIPNAYGGNENLDAIHFLRSLNEEVYRSFPDVQMIAEESTAFPMVSRPTYVGGLGFGLKWNMGWMHDTLWYFSLDPIYRKYHQHCLTFSAWYAFHENFILPLSHDEVVHGKGSLLSKMPGTLWEKFANLRALFGYMYFFPGQKLLFMGGEFGQWGEWHHDHSLEWHLLQYAPHQELLRWVTELNRLYRNERALYEENFHPRGFAWIDFSDWQQSIVSFLRRSRDGRECILVVLNLTPVPRFQYLVGAPFGGYWKEIANSDSTYFGGSGLGNLGGVEAGSLPWAGQPYSLCLTLPPLSVLAFKKELPDASQ